MQEEEERRLQQKSKADKEKHKTKLYKVTHERKRAKHAVSFSMKVITIS